MSVKWLAGYSTDLAYTLGFYRDLAPSFLHYACLVNGVAGVSWSSPLRYCELGCGRGYGTALMAAANPDMTFVGIDFNPSHVAEARALAARAEVPNVSFREMSFSDAARSTDADLGDFDVISAHGVYNWVSADIRSDIHDFLRSNLKTGGMFFVSYNTMPGWAPVLPVQRLLQEVASRSSGDSLAQFDKGFAVLQELKSASSAFVTQNPTLKDRLERMGQQDKRYLIHEFLNAGWQPLYISDMIPALAELKLAYVGSTNIAENSLAIAVPKALQKLVSSAADIAMRELLKDYAVNKQFRRDVYIKGPLRLTEAQRRNGIAETKFALVRRRKDIPKKPRVPAGETMIKESLMDAFLSVLADGPASGKDLIAAGEKAGVKRDQILLTLEVLVYNSIIHPARPDCDAVDRRPSDRLNRITMDFAAAGDTHRFFASPVLGSAVDAPYVERLIAPIVLKDPELGDEQVAKTVIDGISAAGLKLRRIKESSKEKSGKEKEGEDDLAIVKPLVTEFRSERLAYWRGLGILPAE